MVGIIVALVIFVIFTPPVFIHKYLQQKRAQKLAEAMANHPAGKGRNV